MAEFLFKAVPHTEAVDFIRSKPVVSREVFDGLLPELRARAFTISGIQVPADIAQNVRDLIASLPAGFNFDKVKSQIVDALSPYFVDPGATAEERDKAIAASEAKAELLLRVHGQEAYQSAAYNLMRRQEQVFPYWQYQTMHDSKVRPAHRALEGLVLPASSSFWKTHFPPWDWGCRCIVIPLSRHDAQEIRDRGGDNIVDGDRLKKLETENVIDRFDLGKGTRAFHDVAPPEGDKAFKWDPGSLKLDVAQLKERYDADVWNTFEEWAKKTEVKPAGDGVPRRTVWDWLNEGSEAGLAAAEEATPAAAATTGELSTPEKAKQIVDAVNSGASTKERGTAELVDLGYSEEEAGRLINEAAGETTENGDGK